MIVAASLKARREQIGFTLRDVEAITDGRVSNAYLSQLENGKIKSPSIAICRDLAAAYAVPMETIADWLSVPAAISVTVTCPTCGHALAKPAAPT